MSVTGGNETDTRGTSYQMEDCLKLANELILEHKLPIPRVTKQADLKPCIIVQLFKAICKVHIPELISNPQAIEDDIHNVQAVIDTLSLDILSISLFHITGEDVVSQKARSIYNLLEIFKGLSQHVHSIVTTSSQGSETSSNKSYATVSHKGDDVYTLLPTKHGNSMVAHLSSCSSKISSESGSTAEYIALGDAQHYLKYNFHLKTDVPKTTSSTFVNSFHNDCNSFDPGTIKPFQNEQVVKHGLLNNHPFIKDLPLRDDEDTKTGVDALNINTDKSWKFEEQDAYVVDLDKQNNNHYSALYAYGKVDSSKLILPINNQGMKRKRGIAAYTVSEEASSFEPDLIQYVNELNEAKTSKSLLANDYTDRIIKLDELAHVQSAGDFVQLSCHKSTSTSDITDLLRMDGRTSSEKVSTVTTQTQTDNLAAVQETVNLEDIENIYSSNALHRLSEKLQEVKRMRMSAAIMEDKFITAVKKTASSPKKSANRKKSFLLPKHLCKRSQKPSKVPSQSSSVSVKELKVTSGDPVIQELQKQFPAVQFSPSTLKQMEKKHKQHLHLLEKAVDATLSKKPKSQVYMEEQIVKQKKVSAIIKKEASHSQRIRDECQHRQQQQELKSALHKRKVQTIRLRQYHNDFHMQLRSRMQRTRTLEERLVSRLFEDTLKAEREDLREMQQLLKEEEGKDTEFHKEYIEALQTFHQNHYAQVVDEIENRKYGLQQQVKEQSRILRERNHDARRKLEHDVKTMQKETIDHLDDPFIVELETQMLREMLYNKRK